MANPVYATLTADVETVLTLDANYGQIEVALISGAALTCFNATDTAITTVAGGPVNGNHVLTTTLPAKVVVDGTGGAVSKVHLRSAGTPVVSVMGL